MMKNPCRFSALALSALMLWNPVNAEEPLQSHESIHETVKDYLVQNIDPSSEFEITVIPIDNLLRLPARQDPLQAYTTGDLGKATGGRVAVGVRCNSGNKWSVFVSAVIKFFQEVPVLTQSVHRGDIITRQHFTFERREISRFNGEFATLPEQLENKQAMRFLAAGSVLSPKVVMEPMLIRRGEKIVISSSQPGFSIRMNGLAMMDGARGQKIRIKNESSGRIISATVVEPGVVSVDY